MLHCYKNVNYTNKMDSQKRKKKHQNQNTINYYYMSKCCSNSLNTKNKDS